MRGSGNTYRGPGLPVIPAAAAAPLTVTAGLAGAVGGAGSDVYTDLYTDVYSQAVLVSAGMNAA